MQAYPITDQYLHQIVQIIAKTNQAFVPSTEEYSHSNLYYNVLSDRIQGRWITSGDRRMILSFHLASGQLQWLDSHETSLWSALATGKTYAELEQQALAGLQEVGLLAEAYPDKMPFEIPDYAFKSKAFAPFDPVALNEWRHFRRLAIFAAQLLMDHLQADSEIRIWPHHFDTGIYLEAADRPGMGFGLAMQDEMVGAPYFYLAAYPKEGKINYAQKPNLIKGHWEIHEGWKGAVLSLEELHEQELNRQLEITQTWLWQVSRFFR